MNEAAGSDVTGDGGEVRGKEKRFGRDGNA
jgi:hypothetical protein